jgi:hypothetical protein
MTVSILSVGPDHSASDVETVAHSRFGCCDRGHGLFVCGIDADPLMKVSDRGSLGGALGEIRTPDPQIRSLVLYPAELRALRPLVTAAIRVEYTRSVQFCHGGR